MNKQIKVTSQDEQSCVQGQSYSQQVNNLFLTNQLLAKNKKQSQYQKLRVYEQKIHKLKKLLQKVPSTQDQLITSSQKNSGRKQSFIKDKKDSSLPKNGVKRFGKSIDINRIPVSQENSQQQQMIIKKLKALQQKKQSVLKKIKVIEKIEEEIEGYTGFIGYAKVKSKQINAQTHEKITQMSEQIRELVSLFEEEHADVEPIFLINKINQMFIYLFDQQRSQSSWNIETQRVQINQESKNRNQFLNLDRQRQAARFQFMMNTIMRVRKLIKGHSQNCSKFDEMINKGSWSGLPQDFMQSCVRQIIEWLGQKEIQIMSQYKKSQVKYPKDSLENSQNRFLFHSAHPNFHGNQKIGKVSNIKSVGMFQLNPNVHSSNRTCGLEFQSPKGNKQRKQYDYQQNINQKDESQLQFKDQNRKLQAINQNIANQQGILKSLMENVQKWEQKQRIIHESVKKIEMARQTLDQRMKESMEQLGDLVSKMMSMNDEDIAKEQESREQTEHLMRLLNLQTKGSKQTLKNYSKSSKSSNYSGRFKTLNNNSIPSKESSLAAINKADMETFRESKAESRYLTNFQPMLSKLKQLIQSKKEATISTAENYSCMTELFNKLKDKYRAQQTKLQKIEHSIVQKESHHKQLADIITRLTHQQVQLNQVVKRSRKEASDAQNLAAIRKNNFEQLEKKYESMRKKKSALKQKLQEVQDQTSRNELFLEDVSRRVEQKDKYLAQIQSKIQDILYQRQNVIAQMESIEEQSEQKQRTLEQFDKNIRNKSKNLMQVTNKLAQIQADFQQRNKQYTQIRQKYAKMNQEFQQKSNLVKSLTKNYSQVKQQLEQIQRKLPIKLQEMQQAILNKKQLDQGIQDLQKHFKSLMGDVQQMNNAKEKLSNQLSQMLKKQESIQIMLGEKNHKLQEIEDAVNKKSEQFDQLSELYTKVNNDYEENSRKLQQVNCSLKELSKQEQQKQSKMQQIRSKFFQQRQEEHNLVQRIEKLKEIQATIVLKGYWMLNNIENTNCNNEPDKKQFKNSLKQIHAPQVNLLKKRANQIVKSYQQVEQVKQRLLKEQYENRKLRTQNQKLLRVLETDLDKDSLIQFNEQSSLIPPHTNLNQSRARAKSIKNMQQFKKSQASINQRVSGTVGKQNRKVSDILNSYARSTDRFGDHFEQEF